MKIAVLLSGGVDSSVALKLLIDENEHDITAYYLKIWLEDELAFLGDCPWEEDLNYAKAVCEQFNIPLKVISLQQDYLDKIVTYTLAELRAGRTPSPDIYCNERIKFGVFFEHMANDVDYVASGHYARIKKNKNGEFGLFRAPDPIKDQTYFLSNLNQSQLSRILFPLGHLNKNEVRELADGYDLPNKTRKDSQGICFLGKIDYRDFVKFHLGEKEGHIVELETDRVWGKHKGVWFHTIGQRKGLGLGEGPWYVVKKDLEKNIIYISHSEQFEEKARDEFKVHQVNWINSESSFKRAKQLKLRHGPELIPCSLTYDGSDVYHVKIEVSDTGIATGQHAIFYDGEECLGGGTISE